MGVTTAMLLARPARHVWIRNQVARPEDYVVDWTARMSAAETIKVSTFELPKSDLVAVKACNDRVGDRADLRRHDRAGL